MGGVAEDDRKLMGKYGKIIGKYGKIMGNSWENINCWSKLTA